jgi:hypothetical protein
MDTSTGVDAFRRISDCIKQRLVIPSVADAVVAAPHERRVRLAFGGMRAALPCRRIQDHITAAEHDDHLEHCGPPSCLPDELQVMRRATVSPSRLQQK